MDSHKDEIKKSPEGIEHNYNEHQQNPAPSEEAVKEKNEEGGGQALKWIIPICVVVLFIIYFLIKK